MLGSLPSSYLKWVSTNLRAQDLEDWAKLADQVLQDPVYQDRLEWEFAQNALDRNRSNSSSSFSSGVSDLVEISERFGWDNEDKIGWSGVNFVLLGTSKSGRIPRLGGKDGGKRERKEGGKVEGESGGRRRSARRERVRLRMKREKKLGIVEKGRGSLGNDSISSGNAVGFFEKKNEMVGEIYNPFLGREALLKNVMLQKRFV
ncbi:hypothetical protein L484_002022 [Morus notabilis]|uniref:Uncharacterized protein n=2 Tax=Morus notabilis TaxID=981085 RepID=W9QTF5_9ROSA|nr:hypothetical protein L484_002022 [Morus notabilis]